MNYGAMDLRYSGMWERKQRVNWDLELRWEKLSESWLYECGNGTSTAWNDLFSPKL